MGRIARAILGGAQAGPSGADPLDPAAAPFGSYRASARLERFRDAMLLLRGLPALGRLGYKLLAHHLKNNAPILDVEYLGGKFRCMVRENGQDRWVLRRGEHPEQQELQNIFDQEPEPSVFVDIGANNGYFSVIAGLRLPRGSRILAFEPHPRTFRKLLANLSFNNLDCVEVHNVALGAEEERRTLRSTPSADGSNSFVLGEGASVEVPVRPLLDVLRQSGMDRIDILKIDIEGYEDRVLIPFLESAPRALWPRLVIIEKTNRTGAWERDCFAALAERGYSAIRETLDNVWFGAGDPGAVSS